MFNLPRIQCPFAPQFDPKGFGIAVHIVDPVGVNGARRRIQLDLEGFAFALEIVMSTLSLTIPFSEQRLSSFCEKEV